MLSTILAAIQKILTGLVDLVFSILSRAGTFLTTVIDDIFTFLGSIIG